MYTFKKLLMPALLLVSCFARSESYIFQDIELIFSKEGLEKTDYSKNEISASEIILESFVLHSAYFERCSSILPEYDSYFGALDNVWTYGNNYIPLSTASLVFDSREKSIQHALTKRWDKHSKEKLKNLAKKTVNEQKTFCANLAKTYDTDRLIKELFANEFRVINNVFNYSQIDNYVNDRISSISGCVKSFVNQGTSDIESVKLGCSCQTKTILSSITEKSDIPNRLNTNNFYNAESIQKESWFKDIKPKLEKCFVK